MRIFLDRIAVERPPAEASTTDIAVANGRDRLSPTLRLPVGHGIAEHLGFEDGPVLEGVSRSHIVGMWNRKLDHEDATRLDKGGDDPPVAKAPLHLGNHGIEALRILQ